MKLLISVLLLGCFYASTTAQDIKKIEQLLQQQTQDLNETNRLMEHINSTNKQIVVDLAQQRVWLSSIQNVEQLMAKQNLFLDAQSVVIKEALNNITKRGGEYTERLLKELANLARLQLSTKLQISNLEQKLDAYQNNMVRNARNIDNNILDLTKLISRAVLPQLNGLQCSFDSLETSHINIEVELKSLARIKELSENSSSKLNTLGQQLSSLNRTQEARLSALTGAVNQLKPINTWQMENALRELILSQKRVEIDLESCGKHSTPYVVHQRPTVYSQSYTIEEAAPAHTPQPSKPDLVQVWTVKEPNRPRAPQQTSAYADSPKPKPQPGRPSNPGHNHYHSLKSGTAAAHAVSWQERLPWEAAAQYQSVPAPTYKPYKRPSPTQKPCTINSASSSYGPLLSPPPSYAQSIPSQGQQSWYVASTY
ncbi:uncharacterized protein LOC108608320 [Drosophila busckii]|uniref:uncharacterized protein LOC108608320 n=1 Tax=Drosophila busckii TaxID=30019 RepID=UPI001432877B|nr:uncharacterized protein LOC108608320 [Drosophila busckii]